ncbi:MAG: aldo/keto reductase [Thermodesulfovibrionales bacterium]|nr:aldo/keto reductase [Thermodesulfovibrionales bacterium]
MPIPKRRLGKTGVEVTILGLGGEGILRTYGYQREAYNLINRALDFGISYFDCAKAYANSESYYGLALRERRKDIFLASKSHDRSKDGALSHLKETLKNMRTESLDLWQIHDVRTLSEVNEIFSPRGAYEAFIEAKEKGLTRFIGITGHFDPNVIKFCIDKYDFDTVLIPVNPAEPIHKSFIDEIIPLALKKDLGIIGMKVYLRGIATKLPFIDTLEPFFRFALSHPVTNIIVGCDNIRQLEENVRFAENFTLMEEGEKQMLIKLVSPYAKQLMYYKAIG